MTAIVTLHQLERKGACEDSRREFEERFGQSVRVTIKLCREMADIFDFGWATYNLLEGEIHKAALDERSVAMDACSFRRGECTCRPVVAEIFARAYIAQKKERQRNAQ